MAHIPSIIAQNLQRGLWYANSLAEDIPADKFTAMPHPNMNHPAWCYGHLAIYPDRMLTLLGYPQLAQENQKYRELFADGTDCLDDHALYPAKNEILTTFNDRHKALVTILPEVDNAVMDQPVLIESYKDKFPTIGHMFIFIMSAHFMSHLGQISAWRRAIGLGRVF